MITAEQIKAARAFLKWKQSDLAQKAALSLPSINAIEREVASPRKDTLASIQQTLEDAGIEFLGDSGVRLKKEVFEIQQYEGAHFIKALNDDMFSCLKGPQDEVLMCSLNEKLFSTKDAAQASRYDAYQKKSGFRERILVEDGDTFFLANPKVYRWLPKQLMGQVPYLVYKNRFTLIMGEANRIVIVKNQATADTFRQQFEYLWALGKPVPPGSKSKFDDPRFVEKLGLNKDDKKV